MTNPNGTVGVPGLALFIVAVDAQEAAATLWTAFTGWPRTVYLLGTYTEYTSPQATRFGIYATRPFAANSHGRGDGPACGAAVPTEVCLLVADPAEATGRACDLGATLLDAAADRAWGDTVAYLRARAVSSWHWLGPTTSPTRASEPPYPEQPPLLRPS